MKIKDVEHINHLLAELESIKDLITHAEHAEPADFELFVELPGDSSIKMSEQGSSSTHYEGFSTSRSFLDKLKALALEELRDRKRGIEQELTGLGVDVNE
jgi:hypothetical protein